MHTPTVVIFDLLLGQATGTSVAAASNRAPFLISPVAASQYMALLVPIHSKPLSGQQCLLVYASVNVYLRGDLS